MFKKFATDGVISKIFIPALGLITGSIALYSFSSHKQNDRALSTFINEYQAELKPKHDLKMLSNELFEAIDKLNFSEFLYACNKLEKIGMKISYVRDTEGKDPLSVVANKYLIHLRKAVKYDECIKMSSAQMEEWQPDGYLMLGIQLHCNRAQKIHKKQSREYIYMLHELVKEKNITFNGVEMSFEEAINIINKKELLLDVDLDLPAERDNFLALLARGDDTEIALEFIKRFQATVKNKPKF